MTAGQVTSSPTVSQAAHVSNVMTDGEHDLILVQGKINGLRASMLMDSVYTHDFMSQDFVKRHSLATSSGPDDIRITLADSSTISRQIVTTGYVKVVAKDFSETQYFTVYPLSCYDAILGYPRLFRNNPNITFQTNQVVLGNRNISVPGVTSRAAPQVTLGWWRACSFPDAKPVMRFGVVPRDTLCGQRSTRAWAPALHITFKSIAGGYV